MYVEPLRHKAQSSLTSPRKITFHKKKSSTFYLIVPQRTKDILWARTSLVETNNGLNKRDVKRGDELSKRFLSCIPFVRGPFSDKDNFSRSQEN